MFIIFYLFYDILLFLGCLVYLPFYCLRGRLHSKIFTRLGFFSKDYLQALKGIPENTASATDGVVWIHAVSVGESRAAESLLRLIRSQWPLKRIVVSTVTPTGYEIIKRILKDNELVFYAPIDISFVVNKFLRIVSPELLIIMETEIWPNLIRLSKKSGACVVIANARISDHSYKRYMKAGVLLAHILRKVDFFCTQTDESAQRLIALGARPQSVKMTGNIKFDISSDVKSSPAIVRLKECLEGSLLLISGSTHDNEEEMMVTLYKSLRKDYPALRLLLAPRHLERIDRIRRIIRLQGLEAVNFSRMKTFSSGQVIVLDTMGDLTSLYQLCDIAFVGGSLVKKGGHNPIEPALFAKPIVFGKNMDNFKEIRDVFIKEKAAIEVDGFQSLEYELRKLLDSPEEKESLGERAKAILDKNRGAATRTFSIIKTINKQ